MGFCCFVNLIFCGMVQSFPFVTARDGYPRYPNLTISTSAAPRCCGWVMTVGEMLAPVVDAMRSQLLTGSYILADETPVDVQAHG